MGLLNALQGDRIYLNVNVWIYALEGYPAFVQELTQLFQAIDQGTITVITSELSLAEALVKPFQTQNIAQQEIYKQAIANRQNVSIIPVQREILIAAAQLRATTKLKLPDAIHFATALQAQCKTFVTNDRGFQGIPGISVVLLSSVISP
jgi:predicted nucleic acid-binding protein